MSASVFLRRFVYGLKKGQIFTTKDVLRFGTRKAVDCALKRLVERGEIVRLTSGVFMYGDSSTPLPAPIDVAKIKAKAYGKKLTTHGSNVAQQLGLIQKSEDAEALTLWVDGSSSSFRYGDVKIVFQSTSRRKIRLVKKGGAGLSLVALWQIGKNKVTQKEIFRCMPNKSIEKEQLKDALKSVPQWLSEFYLR